MGTATEVLEAARSQLGYNGGGTCDAPVTRFGEWFGVQTQWCAEFVSWCLAQAGVPSLGRFAHGEDYCPAWVAAFRAAGRWSSTPFPGAVVFYSWNGDGIADHVGLVESVNADGSIVTIEGNTDDPTLPAYRCGNCCRRKRRTQQFVLGYGQPPYTTSSSGDTADSGGATQIGDSMSKAEVDEIKAYIDKVAVGIEARVHADMAGTMARILADQPEIVGLRQALRDTACAIGGQKSALPDGTKITSIGVVWQHVQAELGALRAAIDKAGTAPGGAPSAAALQSAARAGATEALNALTLTAHVTGGKTA